MLLNYKFIFNSPFINFDVNVYYKSQFVVVNFKVKINKFRK